MNENCLPLLDSSNLQLTKSSLAQVACCNYLERFLEGLVPRPHPQQMLVSWVSVWAWAGVAFGAQPEMGAIDSSCGHRCYANKFRNSLEGPAHWK